MADTTHTISTGESGYCTLCCEHDLDFSKSQVKAYIIIGVGVDTTMKEVKHVPAGCAVVISGMGCITEEIPIICIPDDEKTDILNANLLKGVTAKDGIKVDKDNTYFCLTAKDSTPAFCPVRKGIYIPQGKAYLEIYKQRQAEIGGKNSVTPLKQKLIQRRLGEIMRLENEKE